MFLLYFLSASDLQDERLSFRRELGMVGLAAATICSRLANTGAAVIPRVLSVTPGDLCKVWFDVTADRCGLLRHVVAGWINDDQALSVASFSIIDPSSRSRRYPTRLTSSSDSLGRLPLGV